MQRISTRTLLYFVIAEGRDMFFALIYDGRAGKEDTCWCNPGAKMAFERDSSIIYECFYQAIACCYYEYECTLVLKK
jgi:hypothetical protein